MLLSSVSIERLANIIIGSTGLGIVRNKADVDELLSSYGLAKDKYDDCFEDYPEIRNNTQYSSNDFKLNHYTRLKIQELNGYEDLSFFCNEFINEIYNYDTILEIVSYLNEVFLKDNYEFIHIEVDNRYALFTIDDTMVSYSCYFKESEKGQYKLIQEHTDKCINRIRSNDYSGAITSSRSLLEQILREIQLELITKGKKSRYGGDFEDLFKNVLEKLDISYGYKAKIKNAYDNINEGFQILVKGMNLLRHGMSDAHNISDIPTKKDALLAVNTSKTLANFIVEYYFENRERLVDEKDN